jgi:phage tail sheath protein FI
VDRQVTATVTREGAPDESVDLMLWPEGQAPGDLAGLALALERALRAATVQGEAGARTTLASPALRAARVSLVGDRLQVIPGEAGAVIGFSDTSLQASARPAATTLDGGVDGTAPETMDFITGPGDKPGIYALLDVADVNLLCLPDLAAPAHDDGRIEVLSAAAELCLDKRMFLIIDSPAGWTTLQAARAGLSDFDSVRSDHAALYFPHIQLTDPLTGQLRAFPPSGAVAGVMARTDASRGVWKAPAGTEAGLSGVRALTVPLSDPENGLLNPLAVNCLRSFPVIGPVVWGARTLAGADRLASPWKYVPVRRLALMIEESLYRGTQWVVFEPNDERLWGQIRLNVGAFMRSLFEQGAFQGSAARDAYFVKCDKDTTTQNDVDRGIVNIVVGFAPLKPAEFVVVQIAQITGQVQV